MKQINEQINPVFLQQTHKLEQFTKILRAVLPVECLNHVKVANFRNQTLMLIADSPVWTTRLRQLSPQILLFLQENMPAAIPLDKKNNIIHHLRISTRYQTGGKKAVSIRRKPRKQLQVSRKTADILSQSADSLEDERLKEAMSRLASHAVERSEE